MEDKRKKGSYVLEETEKPVTITLPTHKHNSLLQDREGNTSSKRVAGFILLGIGVVYYLAIGVTSIFKPVADPTTALAVGSTLIITGAGLLGISVVEFLGK